MESIIKAIKEMMLFALFAFLFSGIFLLFANLLMAVSYQEESMNELNELIENLMIDIAEEGIGATAGIGLLWGLFFTGAYASFSGIINLLASTI